MNMERALPLAAMPALSEPSRAQPAAPAAMNPRTRRLLHAPIIPTLLSLAWPNMLVMLAQASTGLIETFWISRLGTDALAGMALITGPAKADPPYGYGWHEHGWRGHGWCCGYRYVYPAPVYVGPPVVYAPPPVVYAAPPPVVYAPPPVVSFGMAVPVR